MIPFLYYVLYTFLIHQMLLDVTNAGNNPGRMRVVDAAYIIISLAIYGGIFLAGRV